MRTRRATLIAGSIGIALVVAAGIALALIFGGGKEPKTTTTAQKPTQQQQAQAPSAQQKPQAQTQQQPQTTQQQPAPPAQQPSGTGSGGQQKPSVAQPQPQPPAAQPSQPSGGGAGPSGQAAPPKEQAGGTTQQQPSKQQQPPTSKLPEFSTNLPKLYEFGAEWCGPCRQMKPIIDGLKQEYKDEVIINRIDVDKNPDLLKAFSIRAIPVQIFFDADGKQVYKHVGSISKNDILAQFQKMGVTIHQSNTSSNKS